MKHAGVGSMCVSLRNQYWIVGLRRLDHTGPLFCRDFPKCMFYVLLFTCAVVRAVHFELVDSLSLHACMLALRRIAARRSLPTKIYFDCATTFQAAQDACCKLYGHLAPQWNFSVPHAFWWGGWWERMVRNMKLALRKSVGSKSLTRAELESVLHEVEACVNTRPLTFVCDDIDVTCPLTPSYFLTLRPVR